MQLTRNLERQRPDFGLCGEDEGLVSILLQELSHGHALLDTINLARLLPAETVGSRHH